MYEIIYNNDRGLTGFFTSNTDGAFTIAKDSYAWVTNDLIDGKALHAGEDVAHSALVQGF